MDGSSRLLVEFTLLRPSHERHRRFRGAAPSAFLFQVLTEVLAEPLASQFRAAAA